MITQAVLKENLEYDIETGVFRWRKKISKKVVVGSVAGSVNGQGYAMIQMNKKNYLAHRLAWLYVYGYFPENPIDHVNRIVNDNRLSNLREITTQCNARNSKLASDNTSGVKGVYFHKGTGKWQSLVNVSQCVRFVGVHEDFAEAVLHRLAAEQCLDWDGCDSSSPAYQYYRKHIMAKTA